MATPASSSTLHQSSSSAYTLDQLDPTTLAISLIPLLPSLHHPPPTHHSTTPPITLPLLAASLSTLPHSVVNAIHFLAQELKSLRETQVLSAGRSHTNPTSQPTNADEENEDEGRESREKWLENQKVNHLKKSISSLTNLQSSLQSRLLTTVDTLSDLQQKHQRDTQQLADERDGVRAVNQVLKRKISTLEKQLRETKQIMESVLERVEVVNKGDWSIVEHGVIHVLSPLPQSSNQTNGRDSSLLSEELCYHQHCQEGSTASLRTEPNEESSKPTNQLSSSSRTEGHRLSQSATSDSQGRTNQRSLALIVELTEELEHLRQEVKVELKSKHDEINRLTGLIGFRDEEIRQLMARLQHFMGLDGFYVDPHSAHASDTAVRPPHPRSTSMVDLEATPRQKPDRAPKGAAHNPDGLSRPVRRSDSADSRASEERRLQEEIKQLEDQLKDVTQTSQFPSPVDRRTQQTSFSFELDGRRKSATEPDRSAFSANVSDDHVLSKVFEDLSNQVAELKHALKEVSRERDALKRLRARNKNTPGSSSGTDLDDTLSAPQTSRALREALDRSQFECSRLNRLLAQSETRILELERQIVEQEAEFERVAERVQEKLKDQRSKMMQAHAQIEQLQGEAETVRAAGRAIEAELAQERAQVQRLTTVLDRRKLKKTPASSASQKDSSAAGSVSSAASSTRPAREKDPFN